MNSNVNHILVQTECYSMLDAFNMPNFYVLSPKMHDRVFG